MKRIFFFQWLLISGMAMVCLLCTMPVAGQLTITGGAQLSISGNIQITLASTSLVNNGIIVPGLGTFSFTGNAPSSIGGSQSTHFYNLLINKSAAETVTMLKPISIEHQINFTAGFLDLTDFDADLGSTGSLNGEQESSHVVGTGGGQVIFNTALTAPASANPGNLGLIITSSQNLGSTIIKRGQQSQSSSFGTGNSILRYYTIVPTSNTALDATIRLQYFDSELNGLDQNTLTIWEKQTGPDWANLGFTTRNNSPGYVEKTTVNALGMFTISSINNALPVQFISFNAGCNGNTVLLTWKTAQEQHTHYYSVERSADGTRWTGLGNIPAAGNTTTEKNYSYVDNTATANSYYRIAEYDMDGRVQFTKVLRADCSNPDIFRIWPNPVNDILYVNISSAASSKAIVKIFDGKGALVKQQADNLLRGNNLISIDVKGMAAGLYYTTISYNNGQLQTQKIIKK